MGTDQIPNHEILATLAELSENVSRPLWLFGGVAVDFLVGRWTRPHGDIDLNALAADRDQIARELAGIGYVGENRGWLTHWHQPRRERRVELVFLEQDVAGETALLIREHDPIGVPGQYPMVAGYLDPDRFAILEGVRFRVCSPVGEWLGRSLGSSVVAGRNLVPKLAHDQRLLESIMPEADLRKARDLLARMNQAVYRKSLRAPGDASISSSGLKSRAS